MEPGADARKGIWPHRDATSALTIAIERGYDEIVGTIHDAERRRRVDSGQSVERAESNANATLESSAAARALFEAPRWSSGHSGR